MRFIASLLALVFLAACGDPPPRQPRKLSPAAANRIRGERFLAENAAKPGVLITPSGLQYRILTVGDGPIPVPANVVLVHFRGTFVDGKVFQDSRDRGDAAVAMPVRMVIRGWTEALQLMPVGSVWELFVPSNLAFGLDNENLHPEIGPNQTLVFKLELIGIQR